MKITILFILAASMSSVGLAQDAREKGDSTTQAPYENKDDILYRKLDNLVAVSITDVPEELKKTLTQSQYRGWQQGKFFRTDDGKIYELQIEKGKRTKVYRFDAQGTVIKKQ